MNKLRKGKSRFNDDYGFTLLGVLLVLIIFSILGFSIISLSYNSVKLSEGERDYQSAFYIAEAGINESVYEVNEISKRIYDDTKKYYEKLTFEQKKTFDFKSEFYNRVSSEIGNSKKKLGEETFEMNFKNQPVATVTRNLLGGTPPQYIVESEGVIGKTSRTITQKFKISLESENDNNSNIPGNIAVYVNKTIDLSGSATINGNVGTRASNGSVKLVGGAKVTGEIFYKVPDFMGLPPFPVIPEYNIPADRIFEKSEWNKTDLIKNGKLLIDNWMTNGYILNMTELGDKNGNIRFKEIKLDQNNNLTINVGEKDREIVVDHLNISNGHIQIVGKGTLTIFVKDLITLGSGSTINDNTQDVNKLKVFQKGSKKIELGGSQKIFGSLFAEKANINIGAGGGFHGDIYTGGTEVNVKGGTSVITQLFLAPHAKFTLEEGGHIKGFIVADSFVGSGGVSVTHNELNGEKIPDLGEEDSLIKKEALLEK